ncbi:MAG: DUF2911 domain-containing protein [Bacteroidota bacterium]
MLRVSPFVLLALLSVLMAGTASAQNRTLTTPEVSPHARVQQAVGLTDLSVEYHRPAVRGRVIFGGLEPFGEVWRSGANENTVFETSTDIRVEGETLPAGRYGLHTIPGETEWTVIFSTMADAWGSYSYDPAEDALRVAVVARDAPLAERLLYRFDAPTTDSATLVLHWAETEVPVAITVDTPSVVLESMERELRGIPGFFWEGWNQIAQYALDNNRRLGDAMEWVETSIARQPTFANRMTQAGLLAAMGQETEAAEIREDAHTMASPEEVRAWARARQRAGFAQQAQTALDRLGG